MALGGGQSFVSPCELRLVHASVRFAPRSQKPGQGAAGVPAQAEPVPPAPTRQSGHGSTESPVRIVCELSRTSRVTAPLVVLVSVPVTGSLNVLTTQVERPPFTTGNGVPNLHPVSLHSKPVPAVLVGPSVQAVPVQLIVKRLTPPSGVGPSGTVPSPLPR